MKVVLSLGAGVQSSTMALMASCGEITPMPECAIFADTQSEPQHVYDYINYLRDHLRFPIYIVTAGSLRDEILNATRGTQRMDARPPFFLSSGGMLRRQCTADYKLVPIQKKIRALLGLRPRQHWPKKPVVEQWIGISSDEVQRAKHSRIQTIQNRWPLIELRMDRAGCLAWLEAHEYAIPQKSACTFCPYHDDAMWRKMKTDDPVSWEDAVRVDAAIRNGAKNRKNGKPLSPAKWYLHRSCQPLDQVDLRTAEEAGQLTMYDERGFAVECEGMCGV